MVLFSPAFDITVANVFPGRRRAVGVEVMMVTAVHSLNYHWAELVLWSWNPSEQEKKHFHGRVKPPFTPARRRRSDPVRLSRSVDSHLCKKKQSIGRFYKDMNDQVSGWRWQRSKKVHTHQGVHHTTEQRQNRSNLKPLSFSAGGPQRSGHQRHRLCLVLSTTWFRLKSSLSMYNKMISSPPIHCPCTHINQLDVDCRPSLYGVQGSYTI